MWQPCHGLDTFVAACLGSLVVAPAILDEALWPQELETDQTVVIELFGVPLQPGQNQSQS